MHIGMKNPRNQFSMGGQVMDTTKEEKDIGVTVACNLKPSAQCAKAARTVQAVLARSHGPFTTRTDTCSSGCTHSMCAPTQNLAHRLGHHGLRHISSGQISSCVASQLHMLSILGSIPAAHTIVGTGGTVL